MKRAEEIRKRLEDLFNDQKLAVLSTQQEGQPYASLVAFIASEDLKHLFFATPKTTRKFSNLAADSRVALLVNSSTNSVSDFHRAIAVTTVGTAEEISGSAKKNGLTDYLAKHPHLEEFVKSPTCALVRVTVRSYYLVENFQNVTEFHFQNEMDHSG